MGTYSGNLIRTYTAPDDGKPASAFAPSPAHATVTTDQYPQAKLVPPGTGAEYAGTGFPLDVVIGGGIILDCPTRDHDSPANLRGDYTDDQARERMQAAHDGSRDRGYVRSGWVAPPIQDAHTVYASTVTEGLTYAPGNVNRAGAPGILRGITSYPSANPDREGYITGYRPGLSRQLTPALSRLTGMRRWRYDAQPLMERRQYVPEPAPAQPAPFSGSPLPSVAPAEMFRRRTVPGLYRDPGTVDAAQLAVAPVGGSDVIGGDLL